MAGYEASAFIGSVAVTAAAAAFTALPWRRFNFRRSHRAQAMDASAMTPSGMPTPAPIAASWLLDDTAAEEQLVEAVELVVFDEVEVSFANT